MREFDYTMLSTYMVCQRRYMFRFIKDLCGKARATAPEFGHAMHSALDKWFKTSSVDNALEAFAKDWESSGGDDPEDLKRNTDKAKKIIKGYISKYQQEPFTVLEHESCFEIPMGNNRSYIGRRDRVVDWQGAIYVLEHKTMSQLGYTTFNRFKPNLQVDGYIYATRQKYPTCHGCVVDAILVAKTKEDYARKIETRTEEEIQTFPAVYGMIADSITRSEASSIFIPNFEMCTYYGQCPYRTICSQPEPLWQRIIDTEYGTSHWDPRNIGEGGDSND